jgi:predicted transcriptional regulator
MLWTQRLRNKARVARRMASKGWSTGDIAGVCNLTRPELRLILGLDPPGPDPSPRPPRPPDLLRRRAAEARRLHFEGGLDAAQGAGELGADPAAVAGYLARLARRQRHRRARGPSLNRARSRREQAALSEWPRCPADPMPPLAAPPVVDVGQVDAGAVAELVEAEASADHLRDLAEMPADWGPHSAPRPGALDGDAVRRIRYWRSRGIELDELARWFSCSVATIKRALQPGYRPMPSPERPAPVPPAIAAAEASEMVRWDPADDD